MAQETTKRTSKTKLWETIHNEVSELLSNSKVSNKFSEELLTILETNLAPKSGGGSSINPPILNEDGTIKEAFCRYHQRYEKAKDIVISKGKSKGYCKASISLWNKTNGEIKKLDSEAVEAMASGDFDKAQEIAMKAKELKDNFNKPEFYDYDRDWANFNGTSETK